jgi:uncharacterized protein YtpQ (UPF0354 family)
MGIWPMKVRRSVAFLAVLISLIAAAAVFAREAPIPKDSDKFSAYMAKRFEEAEPTIKVIVTGPLVLNIQRADGGHVLYLNRVWDICERDRRQCRKQVDAFVTDMSAMAHEFNGDINPAEIRVVVRGAGYIEPLQQIATKHPENAGVFRLIAGDLWMICVLDQPHGIQTLKKTDLVKLGLTEDQGFALGIKNVAATLPPLEADTHVVKQIGLKFAAGDFYESSRMLVHDSWAELSKSYNGHLVVSVPNNDVLIYGNGGGNGDREVLTAFTKTVLEKAPKPISATLFEWTATGWRVVTP